MQMVQFYLGEDKHVRLQVQAANQVINQLAGEPIRATLTADGWTGTGSPYSQTVAVDRISEMDTPVLVKTLTGAETEAVVKAYNKAFGLIFAGESGDGTVTFYAYKKPTTDLTVGLKGV